eukprot:756355-Hanusia_phi.AAC.3
MALNFREPSEDEDKLRIRLGRCLEEELGGKGEDKNLGCKSVTARKLRCKLTYRTTLEFPTAATPSLSPGSRRRDESKPEGPHLIKSACVPAARAQFRLSSGGRGMLHGRPPGRRPSSSPIVQ